MKKIRMKKIYRYTFPIVLSGIGTTPEEAWEDAIEGFMQDPGCYDKFKKGEQVL